MLQEFHEYIADNQLIQTKDTVLLGVSGGVDSMVMLDLFRQSGWSFAVAHCNFNLRGKEADGDQHFVEAYCNQHNLNFHTKTFDTSGYSKKNQISIQMAARELRFSWFQELLSNYGYSIIAVGSHLDDSIETTLINLTKGTGIRGLHGILPKVNNIIHPMLFSNRQRIEEYADVNNISYREDASNSDTKYLRNRIRHQIVPVLKEINPSFQNTMKGFHKRIEEYEKIIEEKIDGFRKKHVSFSHNQFLIRIDALQKESAKNTILFELINEFGFNTDQVSDIIASLNGQPGKVFYSNTHELIKDREQLILQQKSFVEHKPIINISSPNTNINHPIKLSLQLVPVPRTIPTDTNIATLDSKNIRFPLIVRRWKHGDSFKPLGMKGVKKLSDFFTDLKLSKTEKENIFVITSNEEIIWVVGYRINDRYKITPETTQALAITYVHE